MSNDQLSVEKCVKLGWPVHVVYRNEDKEVVKCWPFGKEHARIDADARNSKEGPETYQAAEWGRYLLILARHEDHLKQLEEISRML